MTLRLCFVLGVMLAIAACDPPQNVVTQEDNAAEGETTDQSAQSSAHTPNQSSPQSTGQPNVFPGRVSEGLAIAEKVCAACHVVGNDRTLDPAVGAPPFSTIAANPVYTELALKVFFQSPHKKQMPNLILSDQEQVDVIAYIHSLRNETP